MLKKMERLKREFYKIHKLLSTKGMLYLQEKNKSEIVINEFTRRNEETKELYKAADDNISVYKFISSVRREYYHFMVSTTKKFKLFSLFYNEMKAITRFLSMILIFRKKIRRVSKFLFSKTFGMIANNTLLSQKMMYRTLKKKLKDIDDDDLEKYTKKLQIKNEKIGRDLEELKQKEMI